MAALRIPTTRVEATPFPFRPPLIPDLLEFLFETRDFERFIGGPFLEVLW